MFTSSLCRLAVAISLLAVPAQAASVDLITNGNFEADGFTGFETDYNTPVTLTSARTVVLAPHINKAFSNSNNQRNRGGDHTTGSGDALFVNGSTDSTSVFWRQTVDVAADSDYQFGVWGMIWFGGSVSTQLRINDVAVGTFLIDRFNTLDVWAQDLVDWNSGTATTAKLELINLSTGFSGNDFAVDDITFTGPAPTSMTPVPLPAGLPLLLAGLGGLALLRRRQR